MPNLYLDSKNPSSQWLIKPMFSIIDEINQFDLKMSEKDINNTKHVNDSNEKVREEISPGTPSPSHKNESPSGDR